LAIAAVRVQVPLRVHGKDIKALLSIQIQGFFFPFLKRRRDNIGSTAYYIATQFLMRGYFHLITDRQLQFRLPTRHAIGLFWINSKIFKICMESLLFYLKHLRFALFS